MKKMKMNNKGFSLVELIIVIAIMAILAGALAPALIKYIAKSKRSADVNNANTIVTAVTGALNDEDAYDEIANAATNNVYTMKIENPSGTPALDSTTQGLTTFAKIVEENISGGVKAMKVKSKESKTGTAIDQKKGFVVEINLTDNSVTVKADTVECYPDAKDMK